jgi:predicted nucleotidyltransferase
MRYTHPLDDLLGSQARLRILRYLCTAGGEHTGRETARAIGMGETPTHQALKELSDTLIVLYRVAGRAYYYRLNERHALVERGLRPLFATEKAQREAAVAELLAGMDVPLEAVLLYGSVARGEDDWRSDLDVLLVTATVDDARRATERVWQRDGDLLRRYGVISVRSLSRDELTARAQRGESWLLEALRDGVAIRGSLPSHLVYGQALRRGSGQATKAHSRETA